MRIATWNINGLRARLDFMRLWLDARKPDVLGLQELKITDAEFPTEFFTELGYHVVTYGQKAWNGVAVVSRSPAKVLDRGLAGQEAFGARLLRVDVAGLDFTTVYCPNGKDLGHEDFPKKLAWFDSLVGYWNSREPGAHAVLCGDFNIVPAPLDSWLSGDTSEHIFHTAAERERFDALLRLGLFDLFRERYPQRQEFSWWDYRGGAFHRRHGLRIDLLLGNAATLERAKDVEIDREFRKKQDDLTPSDHAPVFADLD
jgi:exodeoxyribonuclease-3